MTSFHIYKFGLLAFATTWQLSASQTHEENLLNFISRSMLNYPEWAIENGVEPLRVEHVLNFTENRGTLQYTCLMRNQVIHGLSTVSPHSWNIEARLIGGTFAVSYEKRYNFYIEGDYTISGNVFSTIPLNGSGRFRYNFGNIDKGVMAEVGTFRISYFRVVNDHIDISEATITNPSLSFRLSEGLEFDRLEAGGYDADVLQIIESRFRSRNDQLDRTIGANFKKYFEDVFAQTPFSEIIGAKMPAHLRDGPSKV